MLKSFFLILAAAYIPSMLWMIAAPGKMIKFLLAPVLAPILLIEDGSFVATAVILAGFVAALLGLSAAARPEKRAIILFIIAVASFFQGLLAMSLLAGIHS